MRKAELERDGDRYMEDSSGRLGGDAGKDYEQGSGNGVIYKGRGAMKYREQRKRW